MEFLTDLHVHTCGIGTCATASPENMVERYIEAGVNTVVVTNHITRRAVGELGFSEDSEGWGGFCDAFLLEYRRAADAARDRLNVLLGAEIRIPDTGNDFLIFGLTEEILRGLDGILSEKIKTASPRIRESGCLIYQAHPFRNGQVVTDPALLDGIEVCNFNYKLDSRNDIAAVYAEHLGMSGVCGSDFHHISSAVGGGILTEEPIKDNETLLSVLRTGNYRIRPFRDERSVW
ncbi:MAG: PHP domain-containing protein [Clostridia bacterium]|nr:PHP domain-containing protein [Clostridia bacterium]